MDNDTPKDRYEKILQIVRNGFITYAREVKDLAAKHGFDKDTLEETLEIGTKAAYDKNVALVAKGLTLYAIDTLKLADEHGYDTKPLEQALKTGKEHEYNNKFAFVPGNSDWYPLDKGEYSVAPLEYAVMDNAQTPEYGIPKSSSKYIRRCAPGSFGPELDYWQGQLNKLFYKKKPTKK